MADDSSYHLLGVFVQDDLPLGEDAHLILGGRYTCAAAGTGRVRDPLVPGFTVWELPATLSNINNLRAYGLCFG